MACPRPGWPDQRACGAGRGQAIAPPIDGFLLIPDLGCENSSSGNDDREISDVGRYISLSGNYGRKNVIKLVKNFRVKRECRASPSAA
jgi:hypothetical protein